MWTRREDSGFFYEEKFSDNKRTKCLIFGCCFCLVFLVTAALLIYFLYPRIPTISQDGVTVNNFYLNSSIMVVDATVYVKVDNENYVDIDVVSVTLNVTHDVSGDYLGQVSLSDQVFTKRTVSRLAQPVQLEVTAPATVNALNTEYQQNSYVTLRFKGPMTISYLGYHVNEDVDETEQVGNQSGK